MKYQNIFVYSILAIGLLSVPSFLDSIYAQTNMTQQNQTAVTSGQNQTAVTSGQNQTAVTSGQNQTLSADAQALNSTIDDIQGLKDNLMTAKEALRDGNTEEALTAVTEVENQLLTAQPQPKFTGDFQKIKDSIAKADLNKALDDISKVQTDVLKAETEIFKAELPSAQEIIEQNQDDEDDDGDDDN
jgi:hypothetical protein